MLEIDELSLLVWLSRGNKTKLIKALSKWTGCEEEVYTDKELINIIENAIADISRKYHIKGLMYSYFSAKNRWQDYASIFPKKYTYSEIDALSSVILSITKKVFDEKDQKTLLDLKQYYVEENTNEITKTE